MVCAIDQTPFTEPLHIEEPAVRSTIRRKIPLSLSIVSCYLIASGIFQIVWSILIGPYLRGVPILNVVYGVLILAVSRGLRRSSRRWYVCALVVIALALSVICLAIFQDFIHSVRWRFTILHLINFGVWLCIILVMTRPSIWSWFYDEHDVAT
jgi:hypothetical protein